MNTFIWPRLFGCGCTALSMSCGAGRWIFIQLAGAALYDIGIERPQTEAQHEDKDHMGRD